MAATPEQHQQEEQFFTKLGVPLTSLKGAKKAIEANRYSGNVICLVGDAGIGKTQLVKQLAWDRRPEKPFTWKDRRWETSCPVKVLYLAHMQAEDMGVPYPSRAKRNELLQECDLFLRIADHTRVPSKYDAMHHKALDHAMCLATQVLDAESTLNDGTFEFLVERNLKDLPPEGILFLDEWNRADKSVIKSFFTLLEDREIHGIPLIPPGVQIVAAMNPSDGAYSVNEAEKDHAFRRRLSFVAVTVNVGGFIEYAKTCFHPLVVNFITSLPTALYDVKIRNAGKTFPCPANWEKVSNVLVAAEKHNIPLADSGVELTICGHVGLAMGNQFMEYVKDQQVIINPNDVLTKYTEKSSVRQRVRRLLDINRTDVLGELSQAVALQLFAEQHEPAKVAPRLGLFIGDLQPEMAVNFLVNQLHGAVTDKDSIAYLDALSEYLTAQPAYQNLFSEIAEAMSIARAENSGKRAPSPI